MTVKVFAMDFSSERRRKKKSIKPPPVPRAAVMLALGHRIDREVRDGLFKDQATAARHYGLTRARVTQLLNLTLLAPAIQEKIIDSGQGLSERALRSIAANPVWQLQIQAMWARSIPPP